MALLKPTQLPGERERTIVHNICSTEATQYGCDNESSAIEAYKAKMAQEYDELLDSNTIYRYLLHNYLTQFLFRVCKGSSLWNAIFQGV